MARSPRDLLLQAGTADHYEDPALYDHEYRRRRRDVNFYRELCRGEAGGRPARVLELGCGSGRLLVPLLKDGHAVVGVDRSRPMLLRCQERVARLAPARRASATLLQGDFRSLPLAVADAAPPGREAPPHEGRFPLILCPFNAFMHLYTRQDVEACLAGVRALLSPGGLFAFDVLLPDLDWLTRDPGRRYARTRFRHPSTGERLIYSNSVDYDPVSQVAFIRLFYEPADAAAAAGAEDDEALWAAGPTGVQGRGRRVVHLAHRQFFPQELHALLHYNGFHVVRSEGGFDGQPLTHVSTEQVICARVR